MQTKTNNQVYAGFFVRLAAYLIDWLIVRTALLVVKVPVFFLSLSAPNNVLVRDFIFQYSVSDIVIYALGVVYLTLLTYFTGATLGKRLLHLCVVSAEDRKPSFFEILYRETVGRFLSGICLCIGYLMIGLDKKNRGLHDILADTYVVYRHEKKRYVVPPVVYRDVNAVIPPGDYRSYQGMNAENSVGEYQGMNTNTSAGEHQGMNTENPFENNQNVNTDTSSGEYQDMNADNPFGEYQDVNTDTSSENDQDVNTNNPFGAY